MKWTVKNNNFSNGSLDPKTGEMQFLEDVYEMSKVASECVNAKTKVDKEGYIIGDCPESFNELEEWQQDAVGALLAGFSRHLIKPFEIKYDDNCSLSGMEEDLAFAVPLFQAAIYEWGFERMNFPCSDKDKMITINLERWGIVPAEIIEENDFPKP